MNPDDNVTMHTQNGETKPNTVHLAYSNKIIL